MAREMMDSGIEWIGDIPKNWKTKRIKSCTSVLSGYPFDSALFSNTEGVPLVRIRDITSGIIETYYTGQYDSTYIISDGDLLVGMDGDFNTRWWTAGDALLNQRCCKVSVINNCDKRYLYYCLPLLLKHINDLTYSTTVKHLSTGDIGNASIPDIPECQQKKIADYLDSECSRIDSVIEQTRASIEEYKKLKQAVITQAVTKGIRPKRAMKDSGIEWIGEIPVGWDCTLLKRHCNFQTGSTPSTTNEQWFDGDLDWFTPADFNDTYYLVNSVRKLSMMAKEDGVATIIPPNTVMIIGIGGTAGKIGFTTKECSCNQQITAITADDYLYSKYLMYWMIANTKRLKDTALYTTLPIINNSTIGQYRLLVPDTIEEQVEIVRYLDSKVAEIETLINKKEHVITEIEEYKKSLIYEFVTGKKEV